MIFLFNKEKITKQILIKVVFKKLLLIFDLNLILNITANSIKKIINKNNFKGMLFPN